MSRTKAKHLIVTWPRRVFQDTQRWSRLDEYKTRFHRAGWIAIVRIVVGIDTNSTRRCLWMVLLPPVLPLLASLSLRRLLFLLPLSPLLRAVVCRPFPSMRALACIRCAKSALACSVAPGRLACPRCARLRNCCPPVSSSPTRLMNFIGDSDPLEDEEGSEVGSEASVWLGWS